MKLNETLDFLTSELLSKILKVFISTTNKSVFISPPQKLKMCKDYLGFWGLGRKLNP